MVLRKPTEVQYLLNDSFADLYHFIKLIFISSSNSFSFTLVSVGGHCYIDFTMGIVTSIKKVYGNERARVPVVYACKPVHLCANGLKIKGCDPHIALCNN